MATFGNDSFDRNIIGCCGDAQVKTDIQLQIMAVVMLIIIIISFTGNSLVILSICNFHCLKVISNLLICSLAISDLFSPFIRLLPISISIMTSRWVFGCTWCSISAAMGNAFNASSILHLLFITIERYFQIRHPLKHRRWFTKYRLTSIIVFIWTFSFLHAFTPYVTKIVSFRFNKNIFFCEPYLGKKPSLSIVLLSLYFIVPLFFMLFVYLKIFSTASVQIRNISINSVDDQHAKKKKISRQKMKTAQTICVVVGVFFLLLFPYFSVTIVKAYSPHLVAPWIERTALCCAYANSCCNWIVYSVMNKTMRSCMLKLIKFKTKPYHRKSESTVGLKTHNENPTIIEPVQPVKRKPKLSVRFLEVDPGKNA